MLSKIQELMPFFVTKKGNNRLSGDISSENYVPGSSGWSLFAVGDGEINNVTIRGEMHAGTIVSDEMNAQGGTTVWAKNVGRLLVGATSNTTFSVTMEESKSGHFSFAQVGDVLRSRDWQQNSIFDVWYTVTSVVDNGTSYSFNVTKNSGSNTTLPMGSIVVNYGTANQGLLFASANLSGSPFFDVRTNTATPWSNYGIVHARLGRLDALTAYGVIGTDEFGAIYGTDLSNSNASSASMIMSNKQMSIRNVALSLHNGTNRTVLIDPTGLLKMGTNVDSPGSTGFLFNASTGDLLVGQAAGNYMKWDQSAGTITFSGALSAATGDFTGAITAESGSITGTLEMSGAGAAIAIGATPPTSASAGTGIWIDTTGLYGLASNFEQVSIDATTGALVAGAGNVTIDASGIRLESGASDPNKIEWMKPSTSTAYATINSYESGTTAYLDIFVGGATGTYVDGKITLRAQNVGRAGQGGSISVDQDGIIEIGDATKARATIRLNGSVAINGDLTMESDILADGVSPRDIGSVATPFENLYVNSITATTIIGTIAHSSTTGRTANDHHNQSHVLATVSALGGDHTVSGLTAGFVLRATGATTAAFAAILDADLPATVVRTSRQVIAGSGLTGGGDLTVNRTLTVGAGTMITVATTTVGISTGATWQYIGTGAGTTAAWQNLSGLAGNGMTWTSNTFTLGTPSTLTVSTTNAVTASAHTHAITSYSSPGAAAALLSTTAAGLLTLVQLDTDTISDRSGSNLTLSPAGDLILDPVGNDVLPNNNYDISLGSLSKKYLTLHAAELWVETLVAQETIATIGGRILVGQTTTLTTDLTSVATTIYVKHNNLRSGDIVYMEANGQLEFIKINGNPGGTGPYSYVVLRNQDGTGAGTWYAGDAVFNTGTTGNGFIDLYSLWSINGRNLSYIYNWSGTAYSANYSDNASWSIFGNGANNAVGDAVYFGITGTTWNNLFFNIVTAGVYSATIAWEYWNGTAWTVFTPTVSAGTAAAPFKNAGAYSATWTTLASWAATSVNSLTAFWVRARVSAFTSWTTLAVQGDKKVRAVERQYGPSIVGNVRNSGVWNDFTERWAIGNLDGLYDYGVDAYGAAFGKPSAIWLSMDDVNGIRISNGATQVGRWDISGNVTVGAVGASLSNALLSSGGLQLRNNTTVKVDLQSDGDFFIGTNTAAAATTAFAVFSVAQTYNSFAVGVGDILIGDNTAGKSNIWWDKSAGTLHFRGGNTTQAYVNTAGAIVAGAGAVTLDEDGVTIEAGTGTANKISWKTGGLQKGTVSVYTLSNANYLFVVAQGSNVTDAHGKLYFTASPYNIAHKAARMELTSGSTSSTFSVLANTHSFSNVTGGTQYFAITANGNVGIGTGTTGPAEKLHVAGNTVVDAYNSFKARYTTTASYQGHLSWDHIQLGNNGANYLVAGGGGGTGVGGSLAFVVNNTNELSGLYADSNKNGTVAMVIKSTGNVGIGTTSPSYKLDVSGTFGADTFASIQGVDTGNPTASADELRVSGYGIMGNRSSLYFTNASAVGNIQFGIGGTHASLTKMYISSTGNVGIGTTGPDSTLHISTAGTGSGTLNSANLRGLHIEDSQTAVGNYSVTGITFTPASNHNSWIAGYSESSLSSHLIFGTDDAEKMRITTSGNVGIGTTSPGAKLDILSAVGGVGQTVSMLDLRHNSLYGLRIENYWTSDIDQRFIQKINGVDYNVMTFQAGNVGIGTTAPGARFAVTSPTTNIVFSEWLSSTGKHMFEIVESSAGESIIRQRNVSDAVTNQLNTNGVSYFNGGNVGIGTTGPSQKLEVSGISRFNSGASFSAINTGFASSHGYSTGDWGVRLGATGGQGVIQVAQGTTAYDLAVQPYGGNVGIGTATPGYKLDVNGTGRFTSNLYVDGTIVSNGYSTYTYVPLAAPLTSTAWDGDSFSTVSTSTKIDLSAVFGAPANIKAVNMSVLVRDSAAAGTTEYYIQLGPSSAYFYQLPVGCYGGDLWQRQSGVLNCDANGDIWYKTNASGSLTMEVYVRIWGYWV
jgi:hypothetical protein